MHTVGIPVHRLGESTLQWTLRELAPLTHFRKRSGWEHTLAKTWHNHALGTSNDWLYGRVQKRTLK